MLFQIGQRVALTQPVSFHDGGACGQIDIDLPVGAFGTVVDTGNTLNQWVIVHLDENFACLDEWENSVTFDQQDGGDVGVGRAEDYLA